jgi:pimeloyl-ACP methyl ester carboxylesterase
MRLEVDRKSVYAYTGTRPADASRPTVVLVHGAANDHSVFALQSRWLAHHGRSVLAVDLPGHGRSEGPPLRGVEAVADWLVAVLDAAHVRQASIVGHSLGSLAALEAAARHPERVAKIALLGTAVPMAVSETLLTAARDSPQDACEMITGWSHSPARQLGGNPVPGMWMTGAALALMERNAPGALAVDLRACNDYSRGLDAAREVRCPALVVIASRDLMAPPKAAQALVAALAGATVVTLPDCGHAIMTEQPDALLDALRTFV